MLIYAVALAFEALPLIRRLDLVEKESRGGFRIYGEKEKEYPEGGVFLIITGTGVLESAAGTAYVLGRIGACSGDVLINYGIAGASSSSALKKGDTVLPLKFVRKGERDIYPDVLFPSGMLPENFKKCVAVTVDGAARTDDIPRGSADKGGGTWMAELPAVFDNEAYGVIRTAAALLGVHGALSIKTVSDYVENTERAGGTLQAEEAAALAESAAGEVVMFSEAYHSFIAGKIARNTESSELPQELIETWEKISDSLSLSFARREILKNLMRRDHYAGTDALSEYEGIAHEAEALRGDKKAGLEFFGKILARAEHIAE